MRPWIPRPEGYEWAAGDIGDICLRVDGGPEFTHRAFFLGWRNTGGEFDARFLLVGAPTALGSEEWSGKVCALEFRGHWLPPCECRLEEEGAKLFLRAYCSLAPGFEGMLDSVLDSAVL